VAFDPVTEAPTMDGNGRLQEVATGEVGLLVTKITNMAPFEGYTDAEASEKKLFRDAFKKGDCWFNTGDLVRDQGMRHIAFVDRLGDTFRWKGENVATTEVEKALNSHPRVAESVVYGVEVPHADGRAGMAAVTPEGDDPDWAGLAAHLRAELPAYAVPVFLRLKGEQDVTGTFKHRKVELKKEGFSPPDDEAVYWLPPGGDSYELLTADARRAIEQGEISL
ncbi:MAG: long-chain-acyl-CoA synthetase, partial [Salinisphaeraceae bacterium]